MKLRRIGLITVAAIATIFAGPFMDSGASASGQNAPSAGAFLGRWDLTLKAPDRDYPSWLELKQESGQLRAQMVGRWGNARPLLNAALSDGQLTFVSPKEEEDSKADLVFQGRLTGKTMSGTVNGPDGKTWQWVGVRAPALMKTGAPTWAEPIQLFNGKDLAGWTMSAAGNVAGLPVWSVQNGTIVSPGHGPELVSNAKFQNFKLHIEFNCGADSNSGIYLRGRYELQVETESQAEPPSHHTGGVYGFLAPSPELPRSFCSSSLS